MDNLHIPPSNVNVLPFSKPLHWGAGGLPPFSPSINALSVEGYSLMILEKIAGFPEFCYQFKNLRLCMCLAMCLKFSYLRLGVLMNLMLIKTFNKSKHQRLL